VVDLDSEKETVVVGSDELIGLLYIPQFLHGVGLVSKFRIEVFIYISRLTVQQVNFTQSTEDHMCLELGPANPWHPKKVLACNTGDIHPTGCNFSGDCHYGVWHT
jgi:hypothetical protein